MRGPESLPGDRRRSLHAQDHHTHTHFGYRVPFLRRRFELEDILLVGVAVGGSFAVVLGWILWVHWRILHTQ